MRIFYGKGAYRRSNGNLPELKLINMFVEPSPVDEEGVIILSRKGLDELEDLGSDSIAGVFSEAGVFDGDVFTVSGTGAVSFAASSEELGICVDGVIYRYDGTGDAAPVSFPDDAAVRKLLYHDGLFIAIRDDTDEFYASGVLDLATWEPLSFKSAESEPDLLLDAEFLGDSLILFGQASIEPWDNDDSGATVPYTRRELSIVDKGIKDTGCVVKVDQGLFFVSNENMAMMYRGQVPERVSDHAMEERIAESRGCSVFGFVHEGHTIPCIRLSSGTWGMDISTKEWFELQTLGLPNFLATCATKPGGEPVFGGIDGSLYGFGDNWEDGTYPLERRFTAGVPLNGGTLTVDVLSIQANTGYTGKLTGQGSDPLVEMRVSRNGGATWSDWRAISLGAQGNNRTRTRWRRCGTFDEPGALFEFRTTDPVPFRVSGVFVNEQGGGRSR